MNMPVKAFEGIREKISLAEKRLPRETKNSTFCQSFKEIVQSKNNPAEPVQTGRQSSSDEMTLPLYPLKKQHVPIADDNNLPQDLNPVNGCGEGEKTGLNITDAMIPGNAETANPAESLLPVAELVETVVSQQPIPLEPDAIITAGDLVQLTTPADESLMLKSEQPALAKDGKSSPPVAQTLEQPADEKNLLKLPAERIAAPVTGNLKAAAEDGDSGYEAVMTRGHGANETALRSDNPPPPQNGSGQTIAAWAKGSEPMPEMKQWIKNLVADRRDTPPVPSDAEADLVKTDGKNVPEPVVARNADAKKLIDFETHRLQATRLTAEVNAPPEGKLQTMGDESKPVFSTLAGRETDFLKNAAAVADSAKNMPAAREIIAQIVAKAELFSNHKLSEMRIDLKPEFLGKLTISIMVEEGIVTARFIAENQQVKHMLEANMQNLKYNLENQGLKVDRAEVNVALNNGGMFDGSEGNRHYSWEEGRSSGQRQGEAYADDINYDDRYTGELDTLMASAEEQGVNANGNMNFLI